MGELLSSNPIAIIIFVFALIWMLVLAKKDHTSLSIGQHVDMKSVIVSIGVLGTFIGIAIGLWGFDTQNIDDSVPELLEGLKLAFATSIAGMAISIALSSIQKDKLTGGDDELSVLAEINNNLAGIAQLNIEFKGLWLEIRNEQKLTRNLIEVSNDFLSKVATEESIKNFRIEVHEEQLKSRTFLEAHISDMNKLLKRVVDKVLEVHIELTESKLFLKEQFIETNKSLKEALDVLSRGATEEIIKALEKVITDFNQNLTDQFGDNFKQLNKGVSGLLKWQEQFKEIVEKDYGLLVEIRNSMELTSTTLESVALRNEEVLKVYEQLASLINTYDTQIQVLSKQLNEFSQLGEKAAKSFDVLNGGFERVQAGMGGQSEAITQLTQEISRKLPESLGQLENTLVGLTNQFGKDYQSFLENYRKLVS